MKGQRNAKSAREKKRALEIFLSVKFLQTRNPPSTHSPKMTEVPGGGVMHLWAGVEQPATSEEDLTTLRFTRDFPHGDDSERDLEKVKAIVTDPDSTYEEKVAAIREIEHKYAYRSMDQAVDYKRQNVQKRNEWIAAEDAVFEVSSDDSDGIDPDFEDEWGENTREVFSACRDLEVNSTSEIAVMRFTEMMKSLSDADITLTEQMLIWGSVRMMYRKTEPVHSKQWLTGCTELVEGIAFRNRPSLASFLHVATIASQWDGLSSRHREKASRWAGKSMIVFHKRITALKEFGTACPSWEQVNVSQGARPDLVPSVLLHNVIDKPATTTDAATTPTSQIREEVHTAPPKPCKVVHSHFPCNGQPAQPHGLPPD